MDEQNLGFSAALNHQRYLPNLKDSRLVDRFSFITSCIEESPGASFPSIFSTKAKLAGFYRFVNNDRVNSSILLDAISRESRKKLQQKEGLILAIHDTTEFDFSHIDSIEGMGRASRKSGQGFYGHFCIAATLEREIFGILGLKTWTRLHKAIPRHEWVQKSKNDLSNEGRRWFELMEQVQAQIPDVSSLIHVADREGDDYYCLNRLVNNHSRFVIRVKYDRKIKSCDFSKLFDELRDVKAICVRDVDIATRKVTSSCPRASKDYPNRKKRTTQLGIAAKKIEICRSSTVDSTCLKTLELNFVRVFELQPPAGEAPIEWKLVTSEPITESQDLERIVDIYRARWTIEEYFKALKTGCAFEKRGLESYDALLRCLAIFAPVACQIYNLKIHARNNPEKPSKEIATPIQIKILALKTLFKETQLQKIGYFLLAVAALGGHLKHNGPPGWQVIFRGYEKLLQLEQGYILACEPSSTAPPYV